MVVRELVPIEVGVVVVVGVVLGEVVGVVYSHAVKWPDQKLSTIKFRLVASDPHSASPAEKSNRPKHSKALLSSPRLISAVPFRNAAARPAHAALVVAARTFPVSPPTSRHSSVPGV